MNKKQQTRRWIRLPRPIPDAQLRLFCFPYAGGSSSAYLKWPYILSQPAEVCLVELPGRGDRLRETPVKSMSTLVDALAEAISPWLDKPFAFFGHSMGGIISFELAHALKAQGKPGPVHLFLSGCQPSTSSDRQVPRYKLPDSEFIDELARLGGTPPEVLQNAELLKLLLPALRADFELIEKHEAIHSDPLNCPITAMGGLDDLEVTSEELARWAEATTAEFSIEMFPGDHFFVRSAGTKVMIDILLTLRALCHYQHQLIENSPAHSLA